MKNKWVKIFLAALGIIIIYAAVSVLGLGIMINSSLKSQQSSYSQQPFSAGAGPERNEMILEQAGSGADILQIFNTDGSLDADMYNNRGNSTTTNYIYYVADKYINPVRSGKIISRADIVYDSTNKIPRVVFVYGTPAESDEQITAEVFAIKSPLLFSRTLRQFLVLLTITYAIIVLAVIFALSMRYRYEKARRRYIDNVTHMLKTPVTSIKALAETLYDGVERDPVEQKENLELILQQADLQVEMVQKVLQLSNIQTNGIKPARVTVNAEELVRDPYKRHMPACEQKNITFIVSEHINNVPPLYTDPGIVRQIIDMVLDNSIKFTPEGGSILMDVYCVNKAAVFEITDNGIGISKDKLSQIFDRFYTTSMGNSEGNGLGLAIAKELTRSLHERIWAVSREGEGTSVFFTVRLK